MFNKLNNGMKKFLLFVVAAVMTAGIASAQDINSVIETYQNGAMELDMGNKEAALGYFQQALTDAEALGEDGVQIADNCKTYIPTIMMSIATDFINADQLDAAVEQLKKTIETANLYGNEDIATNAASRINQVLMQKGNDFINAKDFNNAILTYNGILADDPTNALAALRLGMAYGAIGNTEEAEKAYLVAAANGQDKNAMKQLSNLFVKKAAASLKAKNLEEALAFALKSNEYLENATAMKVAGTVSASLKKNEDAITYLEKYIQLAPNAKDANAMKNNIAALAQQMGNKEKAIEYFQMIVTDPKYGQTAKAAIEALSK